MKTLRISQKKDYKIEAFDKNGYLLATSMDSGFKSLADMLSRLRSKTNRKITGMTVLCYNDDTFVRYEVSGSFWGRNSFKRV